MKSFFKKIALFVLVLLGVYLWTEPHYTPTAIPTNAQHAFFPRFIAHKSLISENHQGNTFQALQEGLASYVDALEIDVRLSKDKVPFLYHAQTLQEATDGVGVPEEYTWSQLQKFSYKNENSSKIMSLEEVLILVGSQKFLFLDAKTDQLFNKNFSQAVVSLIKKYKLEDTVVVESFNPLFLLDTRLCARDIMVMYDFTNDATAIGEEVQAQFDSIPWLLKQPFFQKQVRRLIRPDILGPRWNVEKNLLKTLISQGYPVISWTVDDPTVAVKLFALGVKGIQTNRPLEMMAQVGSGMQFVYDAGASRSHVAQVLHIKREQDVVDAVLKAKKAKMKISLAGRRHSMGGQTLLDGALMLDMLGLDSVVYNPANQSVRVGAGATWKKIQHVLEGYDRSVKVMQSDNIFSVGGSVGVNVHGWQVGQPPLGSTILSMRVVTADAKVHEVSPQKNSELFRALIGGYGQFGAITQVELETVPNDMLTFHADFMAPENFVLSFEKHVTKNPHAQLAYGRVRVDKSHLFEEVGLFWYDRVAPPTGEKTRQEGLVAFKRGVLRASEYADVGKKMRWHAEKLYTKKMRATGPLSRNNAMNTDIHVLWPLYGSTKDILHEYFVPKENFTMFLEALKKILLNSQVNLLNITIREVKKDELSLMPYARKDVFAFVMLFSQAQGGQEEIRMKKFTQQAIEAALKLEGTFYLPYRLHYTKEELLRAYPTIALWKTLKDKWDLERRFESQFSQYVEALLDAKHEITR